MEKRVSDFPTRMQETQNTETSLYGLKSENHRLRDFKMDRNLTKRRSRGKRKPSFGSSLKWRPTSEHEHAMFLQVRHKQGQRWGENSTAYKDYGKLPRITWQ